MRQKGQMRIVRAHGIATLPIAHPAVFSTISVADVRDPKDDVVCIIVLEGEKQKKKRKLDVFLVNSETESHRVKLIKDIRVTVRRVNFPQNQDVCLQCGVTVKFTYEGRADDLVPKKNQSCKVCCNERENKDVIQHLK